MTGRISHELKHHVPFTLAGTLTGVVIMLLMARGQVDRGLSEVLFSVFHPVHVLFSAAATAAMYRRYGRGRWWATVLIGYVGSVGIATLSDSLIPYAGEMLLGLPHAHVHLGFIEEWYLVNPLALGGIAVAFAWPRTELPHAGHVLLSTWASLFHMTMSMGPGASAGTMAALAVFLFLAVWIPCCTSDIVFPLLFAAKQCPPGRTRGPGGVCS